MGEQVAARFKEEYSCKALIKRETSWGCSSVGRAPALQAGGHEFESHHLQVIMRSAAEPYRAGKRCALVRKSLDAMDGTDIRRISVSERSAAS